jgi:hypothetical protein
MMRSFRERFDPLYPVIVRRVTMQDGQWGDTGVSVRKGKPHLLVRLDKCLSQEAQLLILIHELAHCLQWRSNEESRESDHDAEWGIAYARIWDQLFQS